MVQSLVQVASLAMGDPERLVCVRVLERVLARAQHTCGEARGGRRVVEGELQQILHRGLER